MPVSKDIYCKYENDPDAPIPETVTWIKKFKWVKKIAIDCISLRWKTWYVIRNVAAGIAILIIDNSLEYWTLPINQSIREVAGLEYIKAQIIFSVSNTEDKYIYTKLPIGRMNLVMNVTQRLVNRIDIYESYDEAIDARVNQIIKSVKKILRNIRKWKDK